MESIHIPQVRLAYGFQPNTSVAVMNNSAISLLRQGKNEEAISLLRIALSEPSATCCPQATVQMCVNVQAPESIFCSISPSSNGVAAAISDSPPGVCTRNTDDPSSDSAELKDVNAEVSSTSPSNFFTIYNRVFEFSDMSLANWIEYGPHIPMILLYNTGLAWHRVAFRENSDAKYEIALQYYSVAHAKVIEYARLGIYHAEVCDLLMLGLFNNMGQIHSHFFRFYETRLCVEALFTVFFLIENKRVLTKEEYVFFYMNILLTVNRRPIFAPAA